MKPQFGGFVILAVVRWIKVAVKVQAVACRDRVDQGLQLRGRGAPWTMRSTSAAARSTG